MTLSEELKWRGFVNQTTYPDLAEIDNKKIKFYLGVDPSADSMTIGNLAVIMLARHFVNYGHEAFMLVGGATGMIGDPDGKASERNLKTLEEIGKNKKAIAAQFSQLLAGKAFTTVDNYSWFKNINYLDFLRNVGKHVPMNQMLSRDFVQTRLGAEGAGISYAEFSYSLIQGYDFLHLFKEYGVSLQICGADQWGNSVTGVDLIRRLEGAEANVYSAPLVVNKSTGVKFGKSEEGAVWLDANKTSVYKFYQFWLNTDDAGVIDYLKIYTLLKKEVIDDLASKTKENPGARAAQKALAHAVTELVHGAKRTASVEKVTDVLFGGGDFKELEENDLEILANEIPVANRGANIIDILVDTHLASGRGDAKRLIAGGAVSVNGDKINKELDLVEKALIKKGKNSFALVK